MSSAIPRTPTTARKSPFTSSSAKSRGSKSTPATGKKRNTKTSAPKQSPAGTKKGANKTKASPAKGTKRKMNAGSTPSTNDTLKSKGAKPRGRNNTVGAVKKQNVEMAEVIELSDDSASLRSVSGQPQFHMPTPFDTTTKSPPAYLSIPQQQFPFIMLPQQPASAFMPQQRPMHNQQYQSNMPPQQHSTNVHSQQHRKPPQQLSMNPPHQQTSLNMPNRQQFMPPQQRPVPARQVSSNMPPQDHSMLLQQYSPNMEQEQHLLHRPFQQQSSAMLSQQRFLPKQPLPTTSPQQRSINMSLQHCPSDMMPQQPSSDMPLQQRSSEMTTQPSSPDTSSQNESSNAFCQQQQYVPTDIRIPTELQADVLDNASTTIFDQLVLRMIQCHPALSPQFNIETITSAMLDKCAYALWSECLTMGTGQLVIHAAKYGSALQDVKIRALGMLNLLPGWWFLREKTRERLLTSGKCVDDTDMQTMFNTACVNADKIIKSRERNKQEEEEHEQHHEQYHEQDSGLGEKVDTTDEDYEDHYE